ncbi:DUF3298 domain-containing protein [Mycobacterium heckeshornense]|uniref:Uncharacterized protein n=1 Tax=Mycobacterium heckeshornense TaxID=110505 RepID=A0A2G8B2N0_9MYCO|nr:esterase [Mycobacterium heckeshornense]KMV23192.1 hypothetical protein ACT16_07590 [Mycobacterium heckeshornense]MCV7035279.1 DUF3298 domain-containing protein [Mycobacterium heckeshornense]PIJ31886.1 DUF3298 domain-containing protein [Mycobacterium heckeshornense]BCO37079.1 hypothetical protein MHEC_35120 [Mycobacterium heckeshornense]BCQ09960.1 immunogenic protein MPT64 precursor [Mycobacterium heckeshornense]
MRNVSAAVVVAAAALATGWAGTAGAVSPCASLGGTVDGQMCQVQASSATYTVNMSFPVDYPDEQAITDFLTQNRDGFVNVAQTSASRDVPYQMDVTSEQYQSGQPPRTRSVVLKVFEDLGGPRPSTFYKAFNYDLPRRQAVTFDTLFAPGTKPLDAIYPIVQRDLGRQTGLGGAVLPGTGRDASHYQNFAITDDEVIFYFAPGELLPPVAGASQVRVARKDIPPLTV